jgi:hypothetical protein
MKILRGVILIIFLSLAIQENTAAQCPMCRVGVESNLKNGGTTGKGLNAGILYLLVTPYVLVGSLIFVWWRNKKKADELELEENLQGIA